MSKIVFIGSGNLATHLSQALQSKGHEIVQVYSHTMANAKLLADKLHCNATDTLDDVVYDADYYILALKDSVLREVAERVCKGREQSMFIHTAGSMPLDVFNGIAENYGVLWLVQTFSKNRPVDLHDIPCFIEGNNSASYNMVESIAKEVSTKVFNTDSIKRKKIHLAAVLSSNLANHCYRLAERVLQDEGVDFSILSPLIMETAKKVSEMSPRDAQTGPMVRYDQNVMAMQKSLIHDEITRQIYELMAESIHRDY